MSYLNWDTQVVTDFSTENIEKMYKTGYLFTRVGRGILNKTRSHRVDLSKFEPSSENRRIERKTEWLSYKIEEIPYADYSWHIAKLAKDFYEAHGADFSANKVKELLTVPEETSFNKLFVFKKDNAPIGYAIGFENEKLLHYSYPFYDPKTEESNLGMGMMLKAILYAKESGKDFIYLGALQRPTDSYKLQFKGGEWFDGETWRTDIEPLKDILTHA